MWGDKMGYLLDINKIKDYDTTLNTFETETLYYGSKYYGYENLDESISYKYLKMINKFNGNEIFDYCISNSIILTHDELLIFLYLYDVDIMKVTENKNYSFLEDSKIIEKITNDDFEDIYLIQWI